MPTLPDLSRRPPPLAATCVAIAVVLFALRLVFQVHTDLGMQDEGFLWYGVQRVREGAVPLVDFRSYDPGRYYWCAWVTALLGDDGIVSLRIAVALFGMLGLMAGLLAATRATTCRWALLFIGWILLLWMQPRWKLFEPSFAMGAIWLGVRLFERPGAGRALSAGLLAGLAAFFGRNLGVYTALGLLGVIVYEAWKVRTPGLARRLAAFAGGVVLGYAPMLVMLAFVPGFWDAFIDGLASQAERGTTNLARGAPWPWTLDYEGKGFFERSHLFQTGWSFVMLPLVYVTGLIALLVAPAERAGRRALYSASILVGIAFAHHVSVRSDMFHLAQCYPPLLLALFALPTTFRGGRQTGRVLMIGLALTPFSLTSIGHETPWMRKAHAERDGAPYVTRDVRGDELELTVRMAEMVSGIPAVVNALVPADEALFIAPHRPGFYPLLGRVSPTWDTYLSEPASAAHEERMLRELEHVRWALTHRVPPGAGNQLGLPASHPRVWALLQSEFERVEPKGMPHGHFLWRRR